MDFAQQVQALRHEYRLLRDNHDFIGLDNSLIDESNGERINGRVTESFWLKSGNFLRLVDIPDTLSGDILRLKQALPQIEGNFEINGNEITKIEAIPPRPIHDDDTEDITDELASLPTIDVDEDKHHLKKGKYKSEIQTLLKCQGGSCPGRSLSPHLITLLGKSKDGELVFEKLSPQYPILFEFCSVAIYKRWIQHLVEGLGALHSIGIVHRDIHTGNVLFIEDGQKLVLADLECRWGQRNAPEIAWDDGIDPGWTVESDIYDIGTLIRWMIYANAPITKRVEWPVPAPFDEIADAYQRTDPQARPTSDEISAMLDAIDDDE